MSNHGWRQIERIQKHLITSSLKVKSTVPYEILLAEAGSFSLEALAISRMISYLKKVENMDNLRWPKIVVDDTLERRKKTWMNQNTKWMYKWSINMQKCLNSNREIKNYVIEKFRTAMWTGQIGRKKAHYIREFNPTGEHDEKAYLGAAIKGKAKILVAQLRTGSHHLRCETEAQLIREEDRYESGHHASVIMATASICTSFAIPFIPNTACTKLSSTSTSSSHSKWSISPHTTTISFQCQFPIPLSRTMAFFSFEGEEETKEDPQEEEEDEQEKPEAPFSSSYFDDEPEESELEIAAAYEALYGPAYSGISVLGNDVDVMDKKFSEKGWRKVERIRDGFEEQVVQVRRVTKVVKGGRYSRFRAVMVVGDRKGKVGVGVGKATDLGGAMQKAGVDARRHIVTVPMTKDLTFPHRVEGHCGAAKVMLRPAPSGSGVSAGSVVRAILDLAGIQNGLGKQLGCDNALNNCRAVVDAFSQMKTFREVSELRGIPMEELWK
ncbi:hypothetical protein KI387_001826 [Taxus chinensis]|uniref:Small ribosomal subunit protein uS5c n=1 Tax=Taxus chinensis TaxID=29808 RepID=A0AA38LLU3_TAXCH|nr:hypothetical protein KI387_001826 [Taxus chinensis]